jgi:hypothetical protein
MARVVSIGGQIWSKATAYDVSLYRQVSVVVRDDATLNRPMPHIGVAGLRPVRYSDAVKPLTSQSNHRLPEVWTVEGDERGELTGEPQCQG